VPEYTEEPVAGGMNPVQEENEPPVPWLMLNVMWVLRELVVAGEVPYSFTAEGSDPVEVTVMHLVPVEPGLRPVALNSAVLESSSLSATAPAV
jgi:hypothetical protein